MKIFNFIFQNINYPPHEIIYDSKKIKAFVSLTSYQTSKFA